MKQYLYTPFDGSKAVFETLADACKSLGLLEQTVRNYFSRTKLSAYVWQGGKLEVVTESKTYTFKPKSAPMKEGQLNGKKASINLKQTIEL